MAHGINKQVIQTGGSVNSGTFNVDFGTNTTQTYYKSVTVTDANCTSSSSPLITYSSTPSRDADEVEMVQLKISISQVNNGNFVVYAFDDAMQAEGIYKFNYILT